MLLLAQWMCFTSYDRQWIC
uniref:Uncharacterized protein n=1 Tax=Arundo donax TaxID=35708 RepID=A0A0A8YVX4_ARUDO